MKHVKKWLFTDPKLDDVGVKVKDTSLFYVSLSSSHSHTKMSEFFSPTVTRWGEKSKHLHIFFSHFGAPFDEDVLKVSRTN